MSDLGGLQLLPETRKKIEVYVPGQNRPVIFGVIFMVLIGGLYFGLMAYKQGLLSSLASIDGQLAAIEDSRDKKLESALLDLNRQLAVVSPLLSAHFFWSDAFIKIQSVTQPQVQYQSINADAVSKKITAKMLAANYTVVAKQIAALYTVDSITDVILNKVQSQPTGKLDVTMQINFDTNKFLMKDTKK